jgi:hypothetical protein
MTLSINETEHSNLLPLHFIYCNAECHYPECHYAKCCYSECRGAQNNDIIYLIIFSKKFLKRLTPCQLSQFGGLPGCTP